MRRKNKRETSVIFAPIPLAIILFIFIFLFLLVMFFWNHNQQVDNKSVELSRYTEDKSIKSLANNTVPDKLIVTRTENKVFNLTSFKKTITDERVIRALYTDLEGFRQLSPNTIMSCPFIPAPYEPVNYSLDFYKGSTIIQHLIFTPPGCRNTIKFGNNEIKYGITSESITFANTLQKELNLTEVQFRGYGRE